MEIEFQEDNVVKGSDLETMLEIYKKAHNNKCSLKKESNGNTVYLIVDDPSYGDGILRLCFTPNCHTYVAFRKS